MYLSNWQDIVGIWKASKLTQTDKQVGGPRLGELHYLGGLAPARSVNQIVDYTGFFRDESGGFKYTHVENFDSEAWFENGSDNAGTLATNYLTYQGASVQPQCGISRSYVAVPNSPFIVIRYSLTNSTNTDLTFNILDQIHLANYGAGNVHAWYDTQRNALIADMSASGQFFVILGAFQTMDGYQVGDDSNSTLTSPTIAGWYSFDHDGTLKNNADLRVGNVDLAFNKRLTVVAGQTSSIYMYVTIRGDLTTALAAADTARSQQGNSWFDQTAASYNAWLNNGGLGQRLHFDDAGLNTLFDRALIVIKNIQNPVLGTFSAATNPLAYGYKNWVRDGSITAIALDASGHHAEANQYWRWMATMQGNDGTWKTTYLVWNGSYLSFVEPEYDSVGAFIYGVYRHYLITGDSRFLSDLWPNVQQAADWILSNISGVNGLGAADFSIWEEPERGLEHNSFTQAWYVVGLYAVQCLAEIRGDTALSDWYAGGPASILTALQRPSNWNIPGVWNPNGYYNRGINQDNSVQSLEDSSSNILIALGVIDSASGRAASHIATMLHLLTHNAYGLARYKDDTYYYSSPFDPAGDEVGAPEPVWPQMSMWVAIYEILSNQRATALARLQWFTSTSGKGYMPHGEAVSNVTSQSVLSSMSEPLTAASFIITTLFYEGQYELRLIPPVYNAGTYKALTINPGTTGDWPQWQNVPYFVASHAASARSAMTTSKRVSITNDNNTIYIRVDNIAGSFSNYADEPMFALHVYSEDFAHGRVEVNSLGLDNNPIHRPMSFLVERRSDEDIFRRWSVSGGIWVADSSPISGVIIPQWDSTTGRIEAAIPIAILASAVLTMGNAWANMLLTLAYHDPTSNTWIDDNKILIHYRLSTSDQSWIYGNIEQGT